MSPTEIIALLKMGGTTMFAAKNPYFNVRIIRGFAVYQLHVEKDMVLHQIAQIAMRRDLPVAYQTQLMHAKQTEEDALIP